MSGVQRYVGANFDRMIRRVQAQHKEMTGKDIGYSEATDKLVITPPLIVVQEKKKKGGSGLGYL